MPVIHDGLGSLLQVQNWVLIQRDADYDAATGIDTSLLQHFWSLSIQGQVFLLWPFLFTLCAVTARRLHRSPRAVVAVGFGASRWRRSPGPSTPPRRSRRPPTSTPSPASGSSPQERSSPWSPP